MTDVHDRQTRSRNMAAIKSHNTKPELLVRKELHRRGFRYSLKNKALPGKPDLVLTKYRVAVFVHGCFWHKHDCRYFKLPKSNTQFWVNKLNSNVERDSEVIGQIIGMGYRVFVIWECAFKGENKEHLDAELQKVLEWVKLKDTKKIFRVIPNIL